MLGVSLLFLSCIFAAATLAQAREWCKAATEAGKPEYGVCLPEGESEAKYTIDVVPVVAPGIHLLNDVSITLAGPDGKITKPIPIASQTVGTMKRVHAERSDVGDPVYVHAALSGKKPWKCQRITVWKDFKYWVFDCNGILDPKNPDATYELSGNKLYEAVVQTGNDPQAGTDGGIELTLLGEEKQASPKMLKQSFYPGTNSKVRFRAADVGDIAGIVIKSTAVNDPWYCDFIRIKAEDGKQYLFAVKRWIGSPYDPSVTVHLKPSKDADTAAQDIECHTRAADLFSRIPEGLHTFKVRCPMNCQASEFAHVEGSTVHPASSSICASAIVDGVLSASGGEVVLSVVGSLPKYSAFNSSTGISAVEYSPSADKPVFSYFLYLSDSIDDIDKDVRVVDAYGKLSPTGRLEVRKNGVWGSVCKKGAFEEFTIDSARKACQDLGYLHGIFLDSGCSNINGQNVCAGKGYPVAVAGIMCMGPERSLADCTFEEPTDFCQDHINDVAVQCTNNPPDREPEPGTLRIVDASGAPSQTGIGRLEFYGAHGWGSVCRDNWTKESERVACLEMGYTGLLSVGNSDDVCSDVKGMNFCGPEKQKISAVNVACLGDEPNLRQCPHQTSDPDCVHEEDVVVGCEGKGDPSGIGLFKKEEAPQVAKRQFSPKIKLNCGDRLMTKPEMKGQPGAMFIATCPEGCSEDPGALKGTYVYTEDSPICKAAIHAGAIEDRGGDVVVVRGHKQDELFGSERHEILSEESGPYARTFTVSRAVPSVRAMASPGKKKGQQKKYAGSSALRTQGTSFPAFMQLNSQVAPKPVIPDVFHWYAPANWQGFTGKEYVDSKNMPGDDAMSGLRDFTITARAKATCKEGEWRSILAHSYCEGFELALNKQDELVFEQPCHNSFISTGFKPKAGEWFHVAITYSQSGKAVAIFVDGKRVVLEKSNMEFSLRNHLVIGKASEIDSEHFCGQITAVRVFPYVLAPDQVAQVMKESALAPIGGSDAVVTRGQRRTEDGRVCLTACTSEEPEISMLMGKYPTNPSIGLSCQDTIILSDFNGPTGMSFRVSCPPGCIHQKGVIKGSKLYTEDSSVCKAAIHGGALHREGGEAIVTIHNGLREYEGGRGHSGVISSHEHRPQMRSFSVHKAPRLLQLSCSDDAAFVLKMGVGEKQLVECPAGCDKLTDSNVFGTKLYSPISSVCVSAIHAGTLTNEGGQVEIEAGPQHQHFKGSTQNGITSQDSGYYIRSYACVRGISKKKNAPTVVEA